MAHHLTGAPAAAYLMVLMRHGHRGINVRRLRADAVAAMRSNASALRRLRVAYSTVRHASVTPARPRGGRAPRATARRRTLAARAPAEPAPPGGR